MATTIAKLSGGVPHTIQGVSAGSVALIVQGVSGQTANVFAVQNSAGTNLFTVDNSGNFNFAGTGTVVINESVTGNLSVTGTSTLSGAVTASSTLSVTGATTLSTLSVSGASTLTGAVSMGSTLSVTGASTFTGAGTFNSVLTVLGTLNANGQVNFSNQIFLSNGSAANPALTFSNSTTTGIYRSSADVIGITFLGTSGVTWSNTSLTVTQVAGTSGTPNLLSLTGAAHTGITAATEDNGVLFDFSATKSWASGAGPLTAQREVLIKAPTYNGTGGGALTITSAATLAVTGAPIQGTNMTLSNSYAIWSQDGKCRFDGTGTVETFIITNNNSATNAVKIQCTALAGQSAINFYDNGNTQRGSIGYANANATFGSQVFVAGINKAVVLSGDNSTAHVTVAATSGALTAASTATAGGVASFTLTAGAHTAVTAEVNDILVSAHTDTITGGYATQRFVLFSAPTISAGSALTVTTASTVNIGAAPLVASSALITNAYALQVGGATTQASATGLTYNSINVPAHTVTVTGSANPTSSPSFAGLFIGQITVSNASITTSTAASLYIDNSPVAAGGGSITNSYSLFVGNGTTYLNGRVGIGASPSATNQLTLTGAAVSGGAIALNITPGAHTTITAQTPDFQINSHTITITSGYTAQNFNVFAQPTIGAASSLTVTNGITVSILPPTVSTSAVITNTFGLSIGSAVTGSTVSNAASSTFALLTTAGQTVTLSTQTQVTSASAVSAVSLSQITINQSGGAVTVNNAATLYIANAPTNGASVTLTNAYSLLVGAGSSFFQGRVITNQGANIASANDITLGADGNVFLITGTTQVNTISATNWKAGSIIVLIIQSTSIVFAHNTAGAGAKLFLASAANFTANANATLSLVYDGTQWQEIARKTT